MEIVILLLVLITIHCTAAKASEKFHEIKYEFNDVMISWGASKDLMVTVIHFSSDAGEPHSHSLILDGFGFRIGMTFGNRFNDHSSTSNFYGFHSTSGEIIWKEFWWGHRYWCPCWDTTTIPLQNKYLNATGEFKYNVDEAEPFTVLNDTKYHSRNGSVYPISKIEFYLIERLWTSRLAKFLHIESKFNTRKVSLIATTPGQNPIALKLHLETIDAYDKFTNNPSDENLKKLTELVDERIGYFLMLDKNF